MNLKDYFQFNKKERNGILLLSFILMIVILIYNNSTFFKNYHKTDFSNFEALIPQKEQVVKSKDSLFNFNPNTLEDGGWILLGLSESKLKTLRNYQKSGFVFYNVDDLRKCYAISEEFAQKISGYAVFP